MPGHGQPMSWGGGEFRTPLAAITAVAEVLLEEADGTGDATEQLELISLPAA